MNGKIRAHEIKVETANWPDYVFKENYPLKSLDSLRVFIPENGRLPEVPTASSAEKEGVSLGEMNKILLKKIEELTLHLIQMTERISAQEKRIKELEDKK